MASPLDEHEPPDEPSPVDSFRWSGVDLGVFGIFFGLTVVFVPLAFLILMNLFRPGLRPEDFTLVDVVLIQGVMDLVLVGFIVFLVKVVRGRPFLETIHWFRTPQFRTGFLVTFGASLAITVLIISSFLPAAEPTPIEKLLSSTESIYLFAIFGIGVAPLVEEIIFRGFVFRVLSDLVSARAAVVLTTLLFTGLHVLQLRGNWPAVALIFGVGYVLAIVRERSGSLIPSCIIHASYNGMLFGMAALGTIMQQGQPA